MNSLSESYEECRLLNKHYGTSFYHALNQFPKSALPHINSLCAFDRIVHEMLYNPIDGMSATQQIISIRAFQSALEHGIKHSHSANKYLQAIIHTALVYDLPVRNFRKIINARIKDHHITAYHSSAQLYKYVYDTAGAQAELFNIILEIKNLRAKKFAIRLANAGRIIKLLGDSYRIYEKKNKLYIPQKDLEKFGYTTKSFKDHSLNKAWAQLMESHLTSAQKDIDAAKKHIHLFPESSQIAFEATAEIYNSLIDSIREKQYDIFAHQPRLRLGIKLRRFIPTLNTLIR